MKKNKLGKGKKLKTTGNARKEITCAPKDAVPGLPGTDGYHEASGAKKGDK